MPVPGGRVTRFVAAASAAVLAISLAPAVGATSLIPVEDKAADVPVSTKADGTKPDIVVIYTDDQRRGTEKLMPKVQKLLADEGVRFADAHIPTSTCCPSRVSLLTGQLAQKTGVWTNWEPYGGYYAFVNEIGDTDTIATRLDAAGYRTALVGKYVNGYPVASARKALNGSVDYIPPGWDVWRTYGGPAGQQVSANAAYYDYWMMNSVDGSRVTYDYYGSAPDDYSTRVFGSAVIETIDSTPKDEPLFLLYTPNAPHSNYTPDPKYMRAPVAPAREVAGFNDTTGKGNWIKRRSTVTSKAAQNLRARQIRTLMSVDDVVGDVVDALKRRGTLSNTLLVFASDNSLTWGEFRILGSKNYPYTTKVPLLMRWDDGGFTGGTRDKRLVANIDITRTALTAAGADTSGLDDALNLANPRAKRQSLSISAWRNRGNVKTRMPAYCAIRTTGWLYVRYNKGRFQELYDLRNDPNYLNNLASDRAFAAKRKELKALTKQTCDPMPPEYSWN